ncbi:MAG: hypothetical protein BCS36_08270 [Desulfovibrio sp. MES5]|nr:MAG: hypothetical protein BCS36_08270 [Desulfovibrio sp. MES5]
MSRRSQADKCCHVFFDIRNKPYSPERRPEYETIEDLYSTHGMAFVQYGGVQVVSSSGWAVWRRKKHVGTDPFFVCSFYSHPTDLLI